jgi:VWFA-related protein
MKTAAISTLIALLLLTLGLAPNRSFLDDTRLVSFDVSVTGKNGSPAVGLTKDNFKVYENGIERSVTRVSTTRAPFALVVLVELSEDATMGDGMESARNLVNSLDARDWGAVVAFDTRTDIVVDFTHDKTVLLGGLRRLQTRNFGDSALFDALAFVGDRMKNLDQKGAILLLGSGRDNASVNRTYGQALRRAETSDIVIYTVSVAHHPLIASVEPWQDRAEQFQIREAEDTLRSFAAASGGLSFEPLWGDQYSSIGRTVMTDLRNQYTLTFASANPGIEGKLRKLKVEVAGADVDHDGKVDKLKVRHKRGY